MQGKKKDAKTFFLLTNHYQTSVFYSAKQILLDKLQNGTGDVISNALVGLDILLSSDSVVVLAFRSKQSKQFVECQLLSDVARIRSRVSDMDKKTIDIAAHEFLHENQLTAKKEAVLVVFSSLAGMTQAKPSASRRWVPFHLRLFAASRQARCTAFP